MKISDINIKVDRDTCIACGTCVDRCIMDNLRLSIAPCRQACPLNLNCQGYLRLLAMDKGEEAARELRKHTPFAALLGRVCSQPCEAVCERAVKCHDGAVHIRAVKRYLADTYPGVTGSVSEKTGTGGKSVAVIGSGPAGLMAAHELALAGHAVNIYEAAPKAGGMLRYGAPSYRLPEPVLDAALRQITELGVSISAGQRLGKELALDSLRSHYDAVLLAVGLWDAVMPAIPGVDLPGVYDALHILTMVKRGEFTPPARSAAVIGGGSTAMDMALTLKKLGVPEVRVICLEGPHEMPASECDLSEAAEEGIIINTRWALEAVRQEAGGLALDIRRCLAVFNEKGKFAPELDTETSKSLNAEMLVFAIGQKLSGGIGMVPFTATGLVAGQQVSGRLQGFDNLFAAGDCLNGASSIVHAMASGKKVAHCIDRYLAGKFPLVVDEWVESGKVHEYESVSERSNGVPRGDLGRIPVALRKLDTETALPLTLKQAREEASRCLSCGRAYEANKTCWFCLPCEIDCPHKALTVKMPYLVR